MNAMGKIVIAGLGLEVPGVAKAEDLLTLTKPLDPGKAFDPDQKLGGRGLRYKDWATKLALSAVENALREAGLPLKEDQQPEAVGVVVSSNLGNVDTVCRVAQALHDGSSEDLSPMDLPNASSNVVASTIAIRFGCRAVNLMVCNGATSGLDALYMAANLILAGRARRVLVVGVEPRNEYVRRLMDGSRTGEEESGSDLGLGEGAACVVLEAASSARRSDLPTHGRLSDYRYAPPGTAPDGFVRRVLDGAPDRPDLWLLPDGGRSSALRLSLERALERWDGDPPEILDLSVGLGVLYGALGVFQSVAACLWLAQRAGGSALALAGGVRGDGLASLRISSFGASA